MTMPTTDDDVREHMTRCPDHEMTIDGSDEWRCVTCEQEEGEDAPAAGSRGVTDSAPNSSVVDR